MAERSSPPLLNLFRKYISAFIIPQKPSHWAIVDAMPNAGHGLLHTLLRELELECFTGILEPPVTVEQLSHKKIPLKQFDYLPCLL